MVMEADGSHQEMKQKIIAKTNSAKFRSNSNQMRRRAATIYDAVAGNQSNSLNLLRIGLTY